MRWPRGQRIIESKEYGASYAVLQLARELELDKAIYSKPSEGWVKDVLAMIVGRVVYAGSNLGLSNHWQDTALWELCGVEGAVDVDIHCYAAMDRLMLRQEAIQKTLANKHLKNGSLVLYDITSSYFEVRLQPGRQARTRADGDRFAVQSRRLPGGDGGVSGKYPGRPNRAGFDRPGAKDLVRHPFYIDVLGKILSLSSPNAVIGDMVHKRYLLPPP